MNTKDSELKPTINVKFMRDSQGRNWICYSDVSNQADFKSSGCVLAEDLDYDRMFGG